METSRPAADGSVVDAATSAPAGHADESRNDEEDNAAGMPPAKRARVDADATNGTSSSENVAAAAGGAPVASTAGGPPTASTPMDTENLHDRDAGREGEVFTDTDCGITEYISLEVPGFHANIKQVSM